MASIQSSVRFPWVAVALSLLSSGVGHIYGGRIVKGLFLYSARFILPLLCIVAVFQQRSTGALLFLILLPALATVIIFFYSPIDAYSIAKRAGANYQLKEYNSSILYWLLVLMQLIYPLALTWGIHEYVYEAFLIPVQSMSPNFLSGDRILVNKLPAQNRYPQRGDVVVFRTPMWEAGRTWVSRVIGVTGDKIVIRGNEITINGNRLERERVPKESLRHFRNQKTDGVAYESHVDRRYRVICSDNSPAGLAKNEIIVTVPKHSVFVLGDNRDLSRDSRHIGSIRVDDIVGHVDYIFYPAESWSRFGAFRD